MLPFWRGHDAMKTFLFVEIGGILQLSDFGTLGRVLYYM